MTEEEPTQTTAADASPAQYAPAPSFAIPATDGCPVAPEAEVFQWKPSQGIEIRAFARSFSNLRELIARLEDEFARHGGVPPQRTWRAVGQVGTPIAVDEYAYVLGTDLPSA